MMRGSCVHGIGDAPLIGATTGEDGRCRIVGRIKDMVIRGGENAYPSGIEEVLYTRPDILDRSLGCRIRNTTRNFASGSFLSAA
jgi:acyl-CoA synthetase (AMP-forming)/AMP-acid ligase II